MRWRGLQNNQRMNPFWAIIWDSAWAPLPTTRIQLDDNLMSEVLLAADGGRVVLTKDRKWGTLAKFQGWESYRNRREATFAATVRVKLLEVSERKGLLYGLCQFRPLRFRPSDRPELTRLKRKIRQFKNYLPAPLHERVEQSLSSADPIETLYSFGALFARRHATLLEACQAATLMRRLVGIIDQRIKADRHFWQSNRLSCRNTWKLPRQTLWRHQLPGVTTCRLPGPRSSNPVVGETHIFLETFSQGLVAALDRVSGETSWLFRLDELGGHGIVLYQDLLYSTSSRSVRAMDQASGREIWNFTPYPEDGEWIYTTPSISGDRLIVGDRRGFLWALHWRVGEPIWKTRVSPNRNSVNASAAIITDRVYTATNDSEAVCCDLATGVVRWRSRLTGPCSSPVKQWNGGLLYLSGSRMQLLCPATGNLLWEQEFPDRIRSFCVADQLLTQTID